MHSAPEARPRRACEPLAETAWRYRADEVQPENLPMVAAEAIAAGVDTPALRELAGLPRQALQVLGSQTVKAVLADARYEVHTNRDLVAVVGVLADDGLGDVLAPVQESLLNCPWLAGLTRRPFVALFLKPPDLPSAINPGPLHGRVGRRQTGWQRGLVVER